MIRPLSKRKQTTSCKSFFDRYTKAADNGWETTPRVRVSLLGFNQVKRFDESMWSPSSLVSGPIIVSHAVSDWPVRETKHLKLVVYSYGRLSSQSPSIEHSISYLSSVAATQEEADPEELQFKHVLTGKRYLLGPSKSHF